MTSIQIIHPFLQTPTNPHIVRRVLLAVYSVSCNSGYASETHPRFNIRCFFSCPHNRTTSMLISLPVLHTPISSFRPPCRARRLSAVLSFRLYVTHTRTFRPPMSAILSSQSYFDIIPNLAAFSADSHRFAFRPTWGSRFLIHFFPFRLCITDTHTFGPPLFAFSLS